MFKLNTRFILRLHISLSTNFTAFSIIRQCFVSISPNLSNHRCKRWYGIMCESYGIFICWALALKFVCEFVRLLLNIVLFHPFFCTYHINNLRLLLCLYFLVNIWNQRQVWQRCHCLSFIMGSNIIGTKGLHIYEGASFWKPNTTAFFTRHEWSIIAFTMCCEWCLVCIQKAFLGQWIHYVAPDRTPSQITIFISIYS